MTTTELSTAVDSCDRWTDDVGDAWPITSHWCDACGLPLIPVDGVGTHPCCEDGVTGEERVAVPDPAGYCRRCGRNLTPDGTCPKGCAA